MTADKQNKSVKNKSQPSIGIFIMAICNLVAGLCFSFVYFLNGDIIFLILGCVLILSSLLTFYIRKKISNEIKKINRRNGEC